MDDYQKAMLILAMSQYAMLALLVSKKEPTAAAKLEHQLIDDLMAHAPTAARLLARL